MTNLVKFPVQGVTHVQGEAHPKSAQNCVLVLKADLARLRSGFLSLLTMLNALSLLLKKLQDIRCSHSLPRTSDLTSLVHDVRNIAVSVSNLDANRLATTVQTLEHAWKLDDARGAHNPKGAVATQPR